MDDLKRKSPNQKLERDIGFAAAPQLGRYVLKIFIGDN